MTEERKIEEHSEKRKLANTLNIGSGHHQTCGDERKKKKKNTSGERENYLKPYYIAEISSNG